MYRALAPRNCTRLINPFRGLNNTSYSHVPCCWQISKRNMSTDLSPWNFWNSRRNNPFRQFDNEISRFVNDMERNVFPFTGQLGLTRPGSARVWMNKKEFEVNIDVHNFEPEEIHVKLSNGKLTVSGKHESKADEYGFISREFTREFTIPESVDTETMTSNVDEGVLVIRAKVKPEENPKDKNVKIEIEREEKS